MSWGQGAVGIGTILEVEGINRAAREEKRRYEFDAATLMEEAALREAGAEHKLKRGKTEQFMTTREFGYQVGAGEAQASTTGVGGGASIKRRAESRFREASKQHGQNIMFEYGQEIKMAEVRRRQAEELKRRGTYAKRQSRWDQAAAIFGGGSQMTRGGGGSVGAGGTLGGYA